MSIGGAREVMLNVELRLFAVDRVDADRPRFAPAVALAMDDVERRKLGLRRRICWLARREGAGDGGAGRELERDEARERLPGPARAIERLVVDSGRRRATGVEVPSLLMSCSSSECGGTVMVGASVWIEAGVTVSVELVWACNLSRES